MQVSWKKNGISSSSIVGTDDSVVTAWPLKYGKWESLYENV